METVGIKRLPVRGGEVIETVSRVNLIAALLKICREGNHAMIDDKRIRRQTYGNGARCGKGGSASKPRRGFKELKT
jgi:hypothetical protein